MCLAGRSQDVSSSVPPHNRGSLNMVRFTTAEIDFVADNPGLTPFHCHHQDHQDEGFMGLINYV
jgi:FtsP/CotA-like multicopper oxidase with cupredoxin domain